MIELTVAQIAEIVGGAVADISPLDAAHRRVTGTVEFDSRAIGPGGLFLALPGGARRTATNHAASAGSRGRRSRAGRPPGGGAGQSVVPPSGRAERIGRRPRARQRRVGGGGAGRAGQAGHRGGRAVGGPPGSPSSGSPARRARRRPRTLMPAVLAPLGEVVAPPGSFNNELGHPWTVLRATRRTDYLILEMAARHHGNIAALAEIAPPSIGVVLNVGTAHLGEFGSREVIAQTKAELPQAVPHSGAVVLNADDPAVAAMAKLTAARVVRVSRDNTGDVWAGPVSLERIGQAALYAACPRCPSRGPDSGSAATHQVTNALCAAAVALECGASVEQVAAALTAAPPVSRHRMQVTTRGDGVTVIDDAYNANPDSMRAGLQALAWIAHQPEATRRSWAVLGEMAELGEDAIAEHDRIGRLAVRLDVSRLVVVGTGRSISAMHHGAVLEGAWGSGEATADHGADRTAVNVADGDAALALLRAELRPGDVVLVKASNAAGLGAVADALVADDTCGSVRP
ncbi:UDP-N-acetylmuramoylalanyl-D-glutamyl-2,6-diaminopimelate-D-alanyl-D-alanyl ligase murF [Mycobacterium tuberculosis C]|nr:UDP-N-acetylmuramoylalanyl-D-glutamyl-2,6-diaminopimelate-D-alanyl-D-alanyl ligase murF [Mycobacterium tuberculosis C]